MKKKLTLLLVLMLSVVSTLCSFAFTASAASAPETTTGWTVEVVGLSDNKLTVTTDTTNTLNVVVKFNGEEVTGFVSTNTASYMVKPYIVIKSDDGVLCEGRTPTIKAEKDTSKREVTLEVSEGANKTVLCSTTFTLVVDKPNNTMTYIMIGLIVIVIGYMIYSSIAAKKKQKANQANGAQLKVGDRVKTIGGICGFVTEVNATENTFTLEVGDNSFVKFDMGAIYQSAPAQGNAVEAPTEEKKEEVKVEEPVTEVKEEKSAKKSKKEDK